MVTNGITVPDAGSTTQYISDSVGGWLYAVTTTITVEQSSLTDFQAKVDAAKAQLVAAQALVDELQPAADSFAAILTSQAKLTTPPVFEQASSTPLK